MHRITLLVKPNSDACKAVRRVIELVVTPHVPAVIEEIDITRDPALLEKYQNRTPVVLVDGNEKFSGSIDPDKLAQLFYDELGEKLLGFN